MPSPSKRCTKCGVLKPLSAYGRHPNNRGGIRTVCKMCIADYMREYRRTNEDVRRRNADGVAARDRALERLAVEHPDEFSVLVDEERAVAGLPPVGESPKGRRPLPKLHGTQRMYRRGCRCEPCRAAHSASGRRYREGKRAS